MASLEATTTNAAGDGNVDLSPDGNVIATSYQNQNALGVVRALGEDSLTVSVGIDEITVEPGGSIDVLGIMFSVVDSVVIPVTMVGTYYLYVVDGVVPLEKEFNITDIRPTWDSIENSYMTAAGERVTSITITKHPGTLSTISVYNEVDNRKSLPALFHVRWGAFVLSNPELVSTIYAIPMYYDPNKGQYTIAYPDMVIPIQNGVNDGEPVRLFLCTDVGVYIDTGDYPFGARVPFQLLNRQQGVQSSVRFELDWTTKAANPRNYAFVISRDGIFPAEYLVFTGNEQYTGKTVCIF